MGHRAVEDWLWLLIDTVRVVQEWDGRSIGQRVRPEWVWPVQSVLAAILIPVAMNYGYAPAWLVSLALISLAVLTPSGGALWRWLVATGPRRWLRVGTVTTAFACVLAIGFSLLPSGPPLHGSAAPDARLQGSIGAANVSRGAETYDGGIPADSGDEVAFQVYVRNMSTVAMAPQPRIEVLQSEEPGGVIVVSAQITAAGFTPVFSSVQIYTGGQDRQTLVPVPGKQATMKTNSDAPIPIAEVSSLPMEFVVASLDPGPDADDLTVKFNLVVASS